MPTCRCELRPRGGMGGVDSQGVVEGIVFEGVHVHLPFEMLIDRRDDRNMENPGIFGETKEPLPILEA